MNANERRVLLDKIIPASEVLKKNPILSVGTNLAAYPWLPFEPSSERMHAFTVAYRLYILNNISHSKTVASNVRLAAVLWMDAHIPLVLSLETRASYTNADVIECLDKYEPCCTFILHPGALPNICDRLLCFGIASTNAYKSNDVLSNMISKTMPARCIVRGLSHIATAAARNNEDIRELLIQVIAVSLMGAYDNINTRPPFAVRRVIYDMFVVQNIDPFTLIDAVKPVLFHQLREFVAFSTGQILALRIAIEGTYDWPEFCRCTSGTMDLVRAKLTRTYERATRVGMPFVDCLSIITSLSVKAMQVPKRSRMPTLSVARMARSAMEASEEHVLELISAGTASTRVHQHVYDLVRKCAFVDGLKYLRIRDTVVQYLTVVFNKYIRDGTREQLVQYMIQLARTNIDDYNTLRVYMLAATSKESIQFITLPCAIKRAHETGLEHIVKTAFSGSRGNVDLPKMFAICNQCLRFCGFLSHVNGKRRVGVDVQPQRAMGHRRLLAAPNLLTGSTDYHCGIRSVRPMDTKRRSANIDPVHTHGNVPMDLAKNRRKRAREMRSSRQHARCRGNKVDFYDMSGVALELTSSTGTSKIIMLCAMCAQPYEWGAENSVHDYALCDPCRLASKTKVQIRCVTCSAIMTSHAVKHKWRNVHVYDNLKHADRPIWFEDRDSVDVIKRVVWFCPKHINPYVMTNASIMNLDAVLFATRKDPASGMFAITSMKVGGEVVAVERAWSRQQHDFLKLPSTM
jgi:hypothetical protein